MSRIIGWIKIFSVVSWLGWIINIFAIMMVEALTFRAVASIETFGLVRSCLLVLCGLIGAIILWRITYKEGKIYRDGYSDPDDLVKTFVEKYYYGSAEWLLLCFGVVLGTAVVASVIMVPSALSSAMIGVP